MKNVTFKKPGIETFTRAARKAGDDVRREMVGNGLKAIGNGLKVAGKGILYTVAAPLVGLNWLSNIFARQHEARQRAWEVQNRFETEQRYRGGMGHRDFGRYDM